MFNFWAAVVNFLMNFKGKKSRLTKFSYLSGQIFRKKQGQTLAKFLFSSFVRFDLQWSTFEQQLSTFCWASKEKKSIDKIFLSFGSNFQVKTRPNSREFFYFPFLWDLTCNGQLSISSCQLFDELQRKKSRLTNFFLSFGSNFQVKTRPNSREIFIVHFCEI